MSEKDWLESRTSMGLTRWDSYAVVLSGDHWIVTGPNDFKQERLGGASSALQWVLEMMPADNL